MNRTELIAFVKYVAPEIEILSVDLNEVLCESSTELIGNEDSNW